MCCPAPESPDNKESDPVQLFSGEQLEYSEDLRIKGRGFDFVWSRTYRSRIGQQTAQGNNWNFSYNLHLGDRGHSINVGSGDARRDEYRARPDGTWGHNGFFREIEQQPDGTLTMTFADKQVRTFHPFDGSPRAGKILSMVDRNGNTIRFEYDGQGRLVKVIDTLDRNILISYTSNGLIQSVTDFDGRTVHYEYYGPSETGGSAGDLKSVTTPAVTGTPNGNDFPNGKTTTYTYTRGFADDRLNHNLLTITDGRRNDLGDPTFGTGPYMTNVYSSTTDPSNPMFDRVVRQIWGGDTVDITYVFQDPSPSNSQVNVRTIVNDRVGNVTEYSYDVGNRLVRFREFTGRANPTQPTTDTQNRPTGKLRASDPDSFETRYEYNLDYLPTRIIHPNGNITENVYESDLNPAASPRTRGNLKIVRHLPGGHTPAGDHQMIEESFEYDSDFGSNGCTFNFVTLHVDGRGSETLTEYDDHGNMTRRVNRIPSIVEEWEYNQFGQMTKHTLPDNGSSHRREDVYNYYASGPERGYLESEVVDAPNFALTTTYQYDPVGNVVRKVDPRGNDSQYVVNQLDQVVREISREVTGGSGVRYQRDIFYDANNNRVRLDIQNIDDQGVLQANTHFTTTYEYEILNYLIRQTAEVDPGHNIVTEYSYDGNRNQTLVRYGEATNGNQPNNIVRTLYDERELPFQEIRAEGDSDQSTTQYDYDRNRNLARRSVGLESTPRVFTSTYDGYDRLVQQTDPMGNIVSFSYDENHNRAHSLATGELTDGPGGAGNVRLNEMAYAYDAMDRLIRQEMEFFDTETQTPILDGKATTQTVYSDNSQVVQVVDDNGNPTLTSYDTANRPGTVTDAKGNTVSYGYDANSNVTSVTEVDKSDLGGPDETFVTAMSYDNLDRLIRSVDNVGNTMEYGYDSRSNRTLMIDALRPNNPTDPGNVTRYQYDGLDRLITTTRFLTSDGTGTGTPAGTIVTRQTWDDTSRLTSQTDDNGNATVYGYDALTRQTATTYADDTVHNYQYDVHHNRVRSNDANGSVVTSTYDLLDRLERRDIVPGPGVSNDTTFEVYQYDGLSRVVDAQDDDSLVDRSYDSLSRVTTEVLNGETTACEYDGVGRELNCAYPGGRVVTNSYDQLDRKQDISDQSGLVASYSYIGPGRVDQRDYGNNTRTTYEYDGDRRITRTSHVADPASAATMIDDRTYTWDRMDNKTAFTNALTGNVRTFNYDSVYRLARSTGGPSGDIDYQLDGVGNRTQVVGGPNPGSYTMAATTPEPADIQVNQYTTTPVDTEKHDRNGNLSQVGSGTSISYDYLNRMVQYTAGVTGSDSAFRYDPFGRRTEKVVDVSGTPQTTRYLYQGWQVLEEQDGQRRYHRHLRLWPLHRRSAEYAEGRPGLLLPRR